MASGEPFEALLRRVSTGALDPELATALADALRDGLHDARTAVPFEVVGVERMDDAPDSFLVMVAVGADTRFTVRVNGGDRLATRIADVADKLADAVIDELWSAWPSCPHHPDTHPLQARAEEDAAWWVCPVTTERVVRVGSWQPGNAKATPAGPLSG